MPRPRRGPLSGGGPLPLRPAQPGEASASAGAEAGGAPLRPAQTGEPGLALASAQLRPAQPGEPPRAGALGKPAATGPRRGRAGAPPTALTDGQQRLVESNMPLVKSIARKLHEQMPGTDFDDLLGFGMQGLVEAAQRYDRGHGTVFSTFAYYRVRGAMFDGIRQMGWLPRAEYAKLRFEEKAAAYLETLQAQEAAARDQGSGQQRTVEDEVRDLAQTLQGVATIFVALFGRLAEQIIDDRPGAQEELERGQLHHRVKRALAALPDKERSLIELYYFEDQTLEQVGVQLGLSKSWTSRLHARAVALLRERLETEE